MPRRTATVAELHAQLSTEPNVIAIINEAKEDCEPEKMKNEPHAGRKLLIIGAAVAAALLVVGGIVLFALFGGKDEQPSESVGEMPTLPTTTTTTEAKTQYASPNLVGRSYYDLREDKDLADYKLVVESMRYDAKAAKGQVVEQTPAHGSPIDKGDTITLILSAGKNDEIKVPDVAGWKQEHAKLYLEALGFKVETVIVQVSDYEKDIVDSTDPKPDTTKRIGDTITLRVSNVEPTQAEQPTAPTDAQVPDNTPIAGPTTPSAPNGPPAE